MSAARGIRLLLGNPLLTAEHDGFELVTKNQAEIAEWFQRNCGWRLYVERRYVLLRKTGKPDATRPARTATGKPFDRSRYTLLCLVCAELTAPVTTAELLRQRTNPEDDEAFADVLDFLERNAVLRPHEGKYLVDRTLLARMTAPSTVEETHIVNDPVVYRRTNIDRQALEEAGFEVEERAEGVLLVDPDGLATDRTFPGDGHAETVALALLTRLPATHQELEADTRELITRYRTYQGTAAEELTRQAIEVLVGFGLAKETSTTVKPLPAAARYRP